MIFVLFQCKVLVIWMCVFFFFFSFSLVVLMHQDKPNENVKKKIISLGFYIIFQVSLSNKNHVMVLVNYNNKGSAEQ